MSLKSAIGLLLATAGAGYFLVSNREVKVNKLDLYCDKLPDSFKGKKIMVVSDLHKKRYGDNFANIIDYCKAAEPDYIFFLGDLYSRDETDMTPKLAFMTRLKSIAPLYYILGNHEPDNSDCCEALCTKLEMVGVHVLRNQHERIYCNDEYITIYGVQLPLKFYWNKDHTYHNLPVPDAEYFDKLLGKPDEKKCNFLLSHNPLFFDSYAKWGADVTFSGHCHGGVVRIPLIGGLLSPERKFFPKYTKGIYTKRKGIRSQRLVVTAGLGKLRINNPSEILVCTLKKRGI